MKTLAIQTRSDAMKVAEANPSAIRMKYDSGKYTWHGSQAHYVGREEKVSDEILALWVERRTDSNGPYAQVMCYTSR